MAPRVYREPCGAPGCDYVARSTDESRMMRLVDEHRASEHQLQMPAEETKGRAPVAGSQTEYRRQAQARAARIVPHLASYRRFDGSPPDLAAFAWTEQVVPDLASRLATLARAEQKDREAADRYYSRGAARNRGAARPAATVARRDARAARVAELSKLMWSRTS